jgi:hypothetical protein
MKKIDIKEYMTMKQDSFKTQRTVNFKTSANETKGSNNETKALHEALKIESKN